MMKTTTTDTIRDPECHLTQLPHDVLLRIGATVANLCGVGDYVALSQCSKGLHRVLLESAKAEAEICGLANEQLVSAGLEGVQLFSLEQLAFYQTLRDDYKVFENWENSTLFVKYDIRSSCRKDPCLLDNVAAEKIWKRFPSAVVVIDIFQKELGIFGNDASFSIGRRALEYLGITKDLLKHCRCWFYEAPTSVAKQHPLCQGPPRADGLAVIRFRIEGPNPGQDLLLPPRSDFLDGLSRQRNIEFENMIRNRLRKRHRYLLLPTL